MGTGPGRPWGGRIGVLLLVWALAAPAALEGQNVRGFVFGEESGAPMEGVLIRLLTRTLEPLDTARTDRLGRFTFSIRQPERYVVVAERQGFVAAPQVIEVTPVPLATVGVTIALKTVAGAEVEVASGDERTANLRGQVVDAGSKRPVEGAQVTLVESGRQVLTRWDGRFVLGEVPPGPHRLRVEHLGYATREWAMDVRAGSDYDAQIPVDPQAIPVEDIDVVVRSRAVARRLEPVFERMNRDLGGMFLTTRDFERRGFGPIGDAIRGLPSVQVTGSGNRWNMRFRRGVDQTMQPGCVPEIWVDGVRVTRAGESPAEFLGQSTLDVEIIELFPSVASIPAEYATSALCVIGIWTKRGG